MKSIILVKPQAFDQSPHIDRARQLLQSKKPGDLTVEKLAGRLHTQSYRCSERFSYHLAIGSQEPVHFDLWCYIAILILESNGWVLEGGDGETILMEQPPGSLLLLHQGFDHQVRAVHPQRPPSQPWRYLMVDLFRRERWSADKMTQTQALDLAFLAIGELESLQ